MSNFYSGSQILLPLANLVNLKLDQMNFIVCQTVSCIIGYYFFKYMSPDKVKSQYRHIFEVTVGVLMTLFCFGSQIWYLLAQCIPVFILINILPIHLARYVILFFTLAFLSAAHIARMYYDYGSYTLDITGPLMIATQKLSSLPFNLKDGDRLNKQQPLRRQAHVLHAITKKIQLLEFFSYIFYFHGLMVGPFVFFSDYIRFIEGKQHEVLPDSDDVKHFLKHREEILYAKNEKKFHLIALIIYSVLYMVIEPYLTPTILLGEYYKTSNFFIRYLMMTAVMFFVRQKYYLAWTTCAITNLFAGFGFSGFDSQTTPEKKHEESSLPRVPLYNTIKNFHISKIEMGTSTKVMIENWNVNTTLWLRECVYDRMPRSVGTLAVFACSAIWHGYYSGYYLAFASVALMTSAARHGRQIIRPFVLRYNLGGFYDIVTSICSMFCLNFSILPFALLDISIGIDVWLSLYVLAPLVCTLMIIFGLLYNSITKPKPTVTNKPPLTISKETYVKSQ